MYEYMDGAQPVDAQMGQVIKGNVIKVIAAFDKDLNIKWSTEKIQTEFLLAIPAPY